MHELIGDQLPWPEGSALDRLEREETHHDVIDRSSREQTVSKEKGLDQPDADVRDKEKPYDGREHRGPAS